MQASAIIVAAGSSRRMGFNKLLADLNGHPVLWHTIQAFQSCPDIAETIVVTSTELSEVIQSWTLPGPVKCVEGGAERHLSVANGLAATDPTYPLIAVHDGARPLITPEAITATLKVADQTGAAALARPITDTLKRANDENQVSAPIDRTNVWAMETPQAFHRDLLLRAYNQVIADNALVTDEVSAIEHINHPITLVPSETLNPKITFPTDLPLAETLLQAQIKSS